MTDTHAQDRAEIERVDNAVKAVAAAMPFPVRTEADMGGTFLLQLDLGTRGAPDDEPDRAMIDSAPGEHWWVDFKDGGVEQVESQFTIDSDPAEVAAWIASEARRAGSPAALSSPDFPSHPRAALSSARAAAPVAHQPRSQQPPAGLEH